MLQILDAPTTCVNHRTLKDRQAEIFRQELGHDHTVAITKNNEIDGYLVSPKAFQEARDALSELVRMKAAIPLLIGGLRAGVAIPSTTIEALGLSLPFDWEALNDFQARFPVAITHTEEGAPMPAPISRLEQQQFEEAEDEELIIVE